MADKARQKRIVRQHYGLDHDVTDEELVGEVASLERKHAKGTLDDKDEALAASIGII